VTNDGMTAFYADTNAHVVRVVDHSTGVITTVAGTGTAGNTGDGSPETYSFAAGVRSFTLSHTYSNDTGTAQSSYSVSLDLTTDDGRTASGSTNVDIVNLPPSLSASGNSSVTEGSAYTLNLTAGDPGGDLNGGQWAVDWGDGIIDSGSISAGTPMPTSRTHVYDDGFGDRTIVARVGDVSGARAMAIRQVTINNTAPTLSGNFSDRAVDTDDPLSFSFGYSDPGYNANNDGGGALKYSVDWGDATSETGGITGGSSNPTAGTKSLSHTYSVAGTYFVTLRLSDSQDATDTKTFKVTVNGQVPTITTVWPDLTASNVTVTEGDIAALHVNLDEAPLRAPAVRRGGSGGREETDGGIATSNGWNGSPSACRHPSSIIASSVCPSRDRLYFYCFARGRCKCQSRRARDRDGVVPGPGELFGSRSRFHGSREGAGCCVKSARRAS
jgi:hypothetical protein